MVDTRTHDVKSCIERMNLAREGVGWPPRGRVSGVMASLTQTFVTPQVDHGGTHLGTTPSLRGSELEGAPRAQEKGAFGGIILPSTLPLTLMTLPERVVLLE